MNYLKDLGLTDDDITIINGSSEASVIEKLKLFPSLVKENYTYLKGIGIKNYKEVFMGHTHMFFINPDRFRAIFDEIMNHNDEYYILLDFDAYVKESKKIEEHYKNRDAWTKSCLVNIAKSGYFSSDRTIGEYAEDIWNAEPLKF